MVKQTPQQNVSTQERQSEYRDTHTVKKRVQNGGRNGVFSDGPMGATAPDGFGRKNPVQSWGARTTSSRFRLPAKWGELLGGE